MARGKKNRRDASDASDDGSEEVAEDRSGDVTLLDADNSAMRAAHDQFEAEKSGEANKRPSEQDPEPSTDLKDQSSLTESSPKLAVETKMTTAQPTAPKFDIVNMTPQPVRVKYYEVVDKKSVGKIYKVPAGGTSVHGKYPPALLRARHFKSLEAKKILRLRRSR